MCGGLAGSIEGEPSASCGPARHPTTLMERSISRCCCNGKCRIGEAWYNLADLLDDQGRSQAAIECLRKALLVAPNTSPIVCGFGKRAVPHDRASEWAMRARRSLKFCEIQVNSLACSAGSHADSDQAA
jgi:tetratricopeptide (TPR) repeat protein